MDPITEIIEDVKDPSTASAVQLDLWVSLGAGRQRPDATRHLIDKRDPVGNFADVLRSHTGEDAWYSALTWDGDRRLGAAWESCVAAIVDLDYLDEAGTHAAPPSDVSERLESLARAAKLTGNIFHSTPRGARVVFMFDAPVIDAEVYHDSWLGAVGLCILDFERAGLLARQDTRGTRVGGYFPDFSTDDLARMFYSPCATVDGVKRTSEVIVLRTKCCEAPVLVECALAFSPLVSGLERERKKTTTTTPRTQADDETLAQAVARFNSDHHSDWGPAGGTCSACGHHKCFGQCGPDPERWACFSANHQRDSGGCGVEGDGCWTGDALDMHARENGISRVEALRRDGYLGSRENQDAGSIASEPETVKNTPEPIPFIDLAAASANGIPPVPWIVEGWLAHRDIVVLAGRAGAGKSTLAVDLAVAVASGRTWCGLTPVETGPVIYLDEEAGETEITRQVLRHGAAALSNLHVSSCIGLRLDDSVSLARIESAINFRRPTLVVLDTATPFFAGADENSATVIGERFRPLLRLRDSYGCSFIIIHHLRKSSQNRRDDPLDLVRGSTAFTTQASVVWTLIPTVAGHAVDVTSEKRRGGGERRRLRVEYVELGDRIELRSLDPPQIVETQLGASSQFIIAHMQTLPGRRAKTGQLVEKAMAAGHGERTIKKAIAHLHDVNALVRVKRGLYELPPGTPDKGLIDDEDE